MKFRVIKEEWADIEIDVEKFISFYKTEWEDFKTQAERDTITEDYKLDFVRESLWEIGLEEYLFPSDDGDGVTNLDRDVEWSLESTRTIKCKRQP